MAARKEIEDALNTLLQADRFDDYGPNGLQVEGRAQVRRIVSGVTASLALIDAAIADRADAILVHHGLFWRGQDGRLVGWLGERVRRLMAHGINLFAYHLPLDAHPEFGNNAQLGMRLGLAADARFGPQDLGFAAPAGANASLSALCVQVQAALGGRAPLALPGDGRARRASAGAPAAHRVISRPRLRPASMPS
jgi:putative NIF3 family GTP cyclohydrolase 1 type 2